MQLLKKSQTYTFFVGWITFAQRKNWEKMMIMTPDVQGDTVCNFTQKRDIWLHSKDIQSISHDEGLDQKRCGQSGSIDAVLKKSSDRGKTRGPNLSHQSLPPVRGAWDISIKDGAGWFVSLSKIRRQTRQSLTASSSSALTYPVLGVDPVCNHQSEHFYTADTSYCRSDEWLQQHGLPRFEIESVHALNSVCHIQPAGKSVKLCA